jgi:hypothetical protein
MVYICCQTHHMHRGRGRRARESERSERGIRKNTPLMVHHSHALLSKRDKKLLRGSIKPHADTTRRTRRSAVPAMLFM